MKKKKKFRLWILIVAIIVCLIAIWPLYELLNLSVRDISDYSSRLLPPETVKLSNFKDAFLNKQVWIGFKNSIIYSGLTILLEVVLGSMAGYGLSRGSKRTTRSIKSVQMLIMMVPGVVTLVGTYALMTKLGLTNSLFALALLTAAGGIPSCSFIYMNFINSIPMALDEAARIDGANVTNTFFRIILPQLTPITVTRAIMIAIGAWNNYLMPLYLINNSSKQPIILVIRSAFAMVGGDRNLAMACATCTIGILPVIIVYCILQRRIIASQIGSSIKG
ncbi:MAG: carbohydrate ABC transporter permease [Erysipelotrichaceae bacterium]|nr:carbohydrate ABC transporter permease [Erysipelotrichaceae bacterium]